MQVYLISILVISFVFCSPALLADNQVVPQGILKLNPYPAPSTSLHDLDGATYSLAQNKGSWVFVHFWASWCGPCREEMPAIQTMISRLEAEGLQIAMINTAEDEDTVFSFVSVYTPDIRPLMDQDGQITETWQPRGLPATYLVDPAGQVRFQALGGRSWDTAPYMTFLRQLIKSE